MSKILAIKGHPTRGKEVIELLEMMGGNTFNSLMENTHPNRVYYIGNNNAITWTNIYSDNGCLETEDFFTLEEFLGKYPFKVGDKVFLYDNITEGYVTGMKWDEETVKYCVYTSAECWCDVKELLKWNAIDLFEKHYQEQCEEIVKDTIKNSYESDMENIKDKFRKEFCERCGSQRCSGQDDELEYCERFKNLMDNSGKPSDKNHKMGPKSKLPSKYYEDRLEEIKSKREYDELRTPLDDDDKLATEVTIMGKRILPPDGYLVGKITQTDNGMLVEYVNKEPKYPKTYEKCCEIIGISRHDVEIDLPQTYQQKMFNLFKLCICRDAYWKIAGEKMGLDKPWEPDWKNTKKVKYGIALYNNTITKMYLRNENVVLAFPTEEMRDAFYENFKDLIEKCKELL